ncbi:MAG: hypothetical protein KatS3mg131_0451 [Candidatus Tectimicrobiota bacterium]|nr:MAG: hypothetical protein KatS3mg131_0451 [Candidatus Tectomicrobia bacterium]
MRRRCGTQPILWALAGVLLTAALPLWGQAVDFRTWLQGVWAEALQRGIRAETLHAALNDLTPLPQVLALDRAQPETVLTFSAYLQRAVPPARIARGQQLLRRHRELLRVIAAAYGVQPRFVVALWGIESDYGRHTGSFPVIAALATLAYDGRRAALFRRELLEALHLLDAGEVSLEAMVGSWAGAMGQVQFLPSSFRRFAVDYDGDGRRDVWRSLPDIFASIANYLQGAGWRQEQTWGHAVRLPPGFDPQQGGAQAPQPLSVWQRLGVQRADGQPWPAPAQAASLVMPEGKNGPAFLVYDNFHVLLRWNRSIYFALAVGQLADHLRAAE